MSLRAAISHPEAAGVYGFFHFRHVEQAFPHGISLILSLPSLNQHLDDPLDRRLLVQGRDTAGLHELFFSLAFADKVHESLLRGLQQCDLLIGASLVATDYAEIRELQSECCGIRSTFQGPLEDRSQHNGLVTPGFVSTEIKKYLIWPNSLLGLLRECADLLVVVADSKVDLPCWLHQLLVVFRSSDRALWPLQLHLPIPSIMQIRNLDCAAATQIICRELVVVHDNNFQFLFLGESQHALVLKLRVHSNVPHDRSLETFELTKLHDAIWV
mmetsp:Transcript_1204/g.2743  ORF Transcript_1204/g.2743 Transcript_1204/m.2743 type:complete len:271 (-) Transcript_1204:1129-1941(-)